MSELLGGTFAAAARALLIPTQLKIAANTTARTLPSAMRDALTCSGVRVARGCVCHFRMTIRILRSTASTSGIKDFRLIVRKPPAVSRRALVTR